MTEIERERKAVDEFTFKSLKYILTAKGKVRFRIASGSMEPLIPVHSEIEAYPIQNTPKKFDIIVFWDGQVLMCHYVLHLNSFKSPSGEELLITSGLNSRYSDWPVPTTHVLGVLKEPVISSSLRFKLVLRRWFQKKILRV